MALVRTTVITAPNRCAAIIKWLESHAAEINDPRTLHIEIDCGDAEIKFKLEHFYKAEFRSSPATFNP